MFHPIFRADLPGHIVVPNQPAGLRIQAPALTDIGSQGDIRPVGGVGEFAAGVRVARLDGDGVAVGLVGTPGDFLLRDELENLTIQTDYIVAARLRGAGNAQVLEVVPVRLCAGPRITDVVTSYRRGAVPTGAGAIVMPWCGPDGRRGDCNCLL